MEGHYHGHLSVSRAAVAPHGGPIGRPLEGPLPVPIPIPPLPGVPDPYQIILSILSGGILGGRPKNQATADIALALGRSGVPLLQNLGVAAARLAVDGIPISSPSAGPIFGPAFHQSAIELAQLAHPTDPLGNPSRQHLTVAAEVLTAALHEAGNPGVAGTQTLESIVDLYHQRAFTGGVPSGGPPKRGQPGGQPPPVTVGPGPLPGPQPPQFPSGPPTGPGPQPGPPPRGLPPGPQMPGQYYVPPQRGYPINGQTPTPDGGLPIRGQPIEHPIVPHLDPNQPCTSCGPLRRQKGTLEESIKLEQQQLETQKIEERDQTIEEIKQLESQPQTTEQIDETIKKKLMLLDQINQELSQQQQLTIPAGQPIPPQILPQRSFLQTLESNFAQYVERAAAAIKDGIECGLVVQKLGLPELATAAATVCASLKLTANISVQQLAEQFIRRLIETQRGGTVPALPEPEPAPPPQQKPVTVCMLCASTEDALRWQSGQPAECHIESVSQ